MDITHTCTLILTCARAQICQSVFGPTKMLLDMYMRYLVGPGLLLYRNEVWVAP